MLGLDLRLFDPHETVVHPVEDEGKIFAEETGDHPQFRESVEGPEEGPVHSVNQELITNVLATTSGNMSKLAFECTWKALGIDSIIFGSDYPYESLADMMKFMDSLDLSPEDQEKVFHLNAEKYLL